MIDYESLGGSRFLSMKYYIFILLDIFGEFKQLFQEANHFIDKEPFFTLSSFIGYEYILYKKLIRICKIGD